ncbi:hypothetical protein FRC01_010841 [Tulasnella sp. 417]|nr:hypothetical protein FRC01_010841 [Tulasnella sp. 417]
MFSKLLSALPFSSPKSVPQVSSKANRNPFKISGVGKQLRKMFTRPPPKAKTLKPMKSAISAPIQLIQASTGVARSTTQAWYDDPHAFETLENPRQLQSPQPSGQDQNRQPPSILTPPPQGSPSQLFVEPEPSDWLGTNEDHEDYQAPLGWNSAHEREMKLWRYSAKGEEIAKLEEEQASMKWDGLFSGSPEDCKREGKRARARGIQTWADPVTERVIEKEPGIPKSASDVGAFREKEGPKPRLPRARCL